MRSAATVRSRHAAHYCELANQRGHSVLQSAAEPDVWRTLDAEWSNLRTALDTFEGLDDLDSGAELVVSLVWFAAMSMRFELFGWAEELLGADGIEEPPSVHRPLRCGGRRLVLHARRAGGRTSRSRVGGRSVGPRRVLPLCSGIGVPQQRPHRRGQRRAHVGVACLRPAARREPDVGARVSDLPSVHPPARARDGRTRQGVERPGGDGPGSVTARCHRGVGERAGSVVHRSPTRRSETWREGREWARSLPDDHLVDQMLVGLLLHVTRTTRRAARHARGLPRCAQRGARPALLRRRKPPLRRDRDRAQPGRRCADRCTPRRRDDGERSPPAAQCATRARSGARRRPRRPARVRTEPENHTGRLSGDRGAR